MTSREELIRVLGKQGFPDPQRWADLQVTRSLTEVRATFIDACPNCASPEARILGQYLYYSNLARLKVCDRCDLWYSDLRLNAQTSREHFERAYKDETYFERRRFVLRRVADLAADVTPKGGSLIDIGGAKGHLLEEIVRRRPDVRVVLNDVSREACRAGQGRVGCHTICAGIADLGHRAERFDVMVFCDVIYYEPDLPAVWSVLTNLIATGGTVILRVPNLAWGIRRLGGRRYTTESTATRIRFFNPEHLYVFTLPFLRRQLRHLGFEITGVLPSHRRGRSVAEHQVLRALAGLSRALPGAVLTPSALVIARARPS